MKKRIDYSVYLVTDSELMSTATVEESVQKAIAGGVTLVQLREKNLESLDFYEQAVRVKAICDEGNVPLIINDRIDIALAVDAAGVHIGQCDMPAAIARRIIGTDKILGVSATTIEEAIKAKADGADYLGVGALFATDTKQNAKVVTKAELSEIADKVDLPIVIIGGINERTIEQFRDIDIDGVAVVSAIIARPDITAAAQSVKKLFFKDRRPIERNIKGVIFDLDGTILDSMHVWENIDNIFLGKRGIAVPEGYIDAICAKSFREAAVYTRGIFNLSESAEEIMAEWLNMATYEYSHNVKMLPYADDYIRALKAQGIKIAVATGLSTELYTQCLKTIGIYDLFDFTCSVNEVKVGKESPEIFNYVIDKIGLSAEECIIFEDILPAIISAKKTGAVVYGVKEAYSVHLADKIALAADRYIDDFSQAPILK